MTKYLIKTTYKATDANPNFKDKSQTWWQGKKGFNTDKESSVKYIATHHGYSTKAAVASALKSAKEICSYENAYGFWNSSCEVIEVEV